MPTNDIPFDALREAARQHVPSPIFLTISGAHLYGFPSPDSDFDVRGCHLDALDGVLGLFKSRATLEPKIEVDGREGERYEVEIVSHEIEKYLRLLIKPNGYVLEQIYSPLVVLSTPAHEELKQLARATVCRKLYSHYRGFLFSIRKLLEKEESKKAKRILYLYRVLMTGIHVLRTGEIEANILKLNEHFKLTSIPELIAAKQQEWSAVADEKVYWDEIEALQLEMARAYEESTLPPEPDSLEPLNRFLIALRKEQFRLIN